MVKNIVIDVLVNTSNADMALKNLLGKLALLAGIANGSITPAFQQLGYSGTKAANSASAAMSGLNNNIDKGTKAIKTFDMRYLGLMFSGMALKRAFGGALRSLFDGFRQAGNEQSNFSVKTSELSASWTFLKYSIVNALSNSALFTGFMDGLMGVIDWVSQLINKFPAIGTGLVIAFSVLTAAGTVGMIIGQFMLGWKAVFGVGGLWGKSVASGAGTVAGESGTVAGSVKKGYISWNKIIGAGLIIKAVVGTYKSVTDESPTPFKTLLKDALTFGLGFGIFTGWWAGAAIATGIILITTILSESGKKNMLDIQNFLRDPEGTALGSIMYGRNKGEDTWVPPNQRISGMSSIPGMGTADVKTGVMEGMISFFNGVASGENEMKLGFMEMNPLAWNWLGGGGMGSSQGPGGQSIDITELKINAGTVTFEGSGASTVVTG